MWRTASFLLWLECLTLVLFVPIIGNVTGFSELIFFEQVPLESLFPVVLALTPLLAPSLFQWIRNSRAKSVDASPEWLSLADFRGPTPWSLAIVVAWCVVYILSGGLNVREVDAQIGYAARGPILGMTLLLTNQALMLSVAWWMPHSGKGRLPRSGWRMTVTLILLACVSFSGSRGILFSWFLAYLFGSSLYVMPSPEGRGANAFELLRRILTPRRTIALAAFCIAFALWGALRDQETNVQFSALYRLAEPYWYKSYQRFLGEGPSLELMWDTLQRIWAIPARLFGYAVDGSIDGSNYIIEKYLGITYQEGVSLPITLMGHGLLFGGPWGLGLFSLFTAGLIRGAFSLYRRLPGLDSSFRGAYLGLVFSKICFLYPKSLSGIVLVLFYENIRDYLILLVLNKYLRKLS